MKRESVLIKFEIFDKVRSITFSNMIKVMIKNAIIKTELFGQVIEDIIPSF